MKYPGTLMTATRDPLFRRFDIFEGCNMDSRKVIFVANAG